MLKLILYGVAWFIVINQWHDLGYYYNSVTHHPPITAVLITALVTIILTIATIKTLTNKGDK